MLSEIGDQQEVLELTKLHERLERISLTQVSSDPVAAAGGSSSGLEYSRATIHAILAEVETGRSTETLQEAVAMSQAAPWDGWLVYPHSFTGGMRFRRAQFCNRMVEALTQRGNMCAANLSTAQVPGKRI